MIILSIVTIFISGMFFVLSSVGQQARRARTFPGLLPASFFVGLGVMSIQLFSYYLFGMEYTTKNVVVLPIILLILSVARYLINSSGRDPVNVRNEKTASFTNFERLLLVAMFIQLAWIVFNVIAVPIHSHDVVANFGLKAKMFFTSSGIPEGFFKWTEASVAHPDYPPGMPFLITWVYEFTGFNDLTVNLVMPVIYVSFLWLMFSIFIKFFTRSYSLLMTFLLATVPQLADYAMIMYADLVLCAFVAGAIGYLLLYLKKRDRGCIFTSSMLMGTAVWFKNEAMVFAVAYIVLLAIMFLRARGSVGTRTTSDTVKSALIVVGMALPWLLFKSSGEVVVNNDINIASMTVERFVQNAKDMIILLNLFQQEVFGPKKWNIFWIIFFVSLAVGRKKLWKDANLYVTLFVIISTFGYIAGYMSTTGDNLYFIINTTLSRFMLHFTGVCALLMAKLMYDTVKDMGIFKGELGEYYG